MVSPFPNITSPPSGSAAVRDVIEGPADGGRTTTTESTTAGVSINDIIAGQTSTGRFPIIGPVITPVQSLFIVPVVLSIVPPTVLVMEPELLMVPVLLMVPELLLKMPPPELMLMVPALLMVPELEVLGAVSDIVIMPVAVLLMVPPELLPMPPPMAFDIVMMPELEMVPPELLKMLPSVFDIVRVPVEVLLMVPELEMVVPEVLFDIVRVPELMMVPPPKLRRLVTPKPAGSNISISPELLMVPPLLLMPPPPEI